MRTLIIALFLSGLSLAGGLSGQRRLAGEEGLSFLGLPFVSLQEICQPSIIGDFDGWYSVWVPRYLWDKNNDPARLQGKKMKGSIDDHINQMKDHISHLEKEKKTVDRFPPLLLDIKISRINGETNAFINQEVPNQFADPHTQSELATAYGPHIPDLINHYNFFQVGSELVKWVAKSYRADWDEKSQDKQEPLTAKIDELAEPLRKTLRTLLRIHTQPAPDAHKDILPEHKPTLQEFWDGFKFLLGPEPVVKAAIRDALIQTGKAPVPEQSFFTPAFFQALKANPSDFKPELGREEFLTLDGPKDLLEDIRSLAQPLFFSSDFPKEFTADPTYLDPHHQADPTADPAAEERAKKNAELHRILYLVYLFARLDNTLPAHQPAGNQEILKALKDWVVGTKDFDEQPEAEEPKDLKELLNLVSEEPRVHKKVQPEQLHALLPAPVFRKHFLELVTLICQKIVGCEMKEEVRNPTVLDKVADYGNFDDIRTDNPDSFVPKEIAQEVKENLARHNIETISMALDEELDDMLKDTPDFTEDELDEMDGSRFSDKTLGPQEEEEEVPLESDEDKPALNIPRTKYKRPRTKKDKESKFTPFSPRTEEVDKLGNVVIGKPSELDEPVPEDEEEPSNLRPSQIQKTPRTKLVRKPVEPRPRTRKDKEGKPVQFVPGTEEVDELGNVVLSKPSELEEPELKKSPSSKSLPEVLKVPTFQQVEERRRNYQGRTSPKKTDKIAQILDRFIPKEGELDEQGRKFIEKLDDKAATSDPAKAADLKNIIIEFLVKRTQQAGNKPDKKIEDITKLINKREIDRLMKPLSAGSSAGLRNFFMMTLSNLQNVAYRPNSPLENKFYRHDLLFFVGLHNLDQMTLVARQKGKAPEAVKKELEPFTRELKIAMSHLTGTALDDKTDKSGKLTMAKLNEEKDKVLSRNTVLMHRMPAYHLFVSLFDFFDYFKVAQEANAVYGNYRLVYLNFYSFLVSLRKTIPFEITNPHQYVLAQLERCIHYTATVEVPDQQNVNAICLLSHRKYAEMYYFYKVYMLATGKPGAHDLAPPAGMAFDTNVNVFLNFATQVGSYQAVLNKLCTPDNGVPICRSWTFFNALVSYLQLEQIAIDADSLRAVFATSDFGTDAYLFNVLNAVDATVLNVERGNMKDFAKYNLLKEVLQTFGVRFDSFEDRHVKPLAEYLKRSYKRLFFSDSEVVANGLVAAILAGQKSTDKGLDSFEQVISVEGNYLPDNLSFFLQLATTDEQFERIAQLIVDTNAGGHLLNLRQEEHFVAYRGLVEAVAKYQVTSEGSQDSVALNKGRLDIVRNFMHERISKFSSLCIRIIRNEFHNQALEVEEFNMAEFLISEMDHENKETEKEADEKWAKVGEKIAESVDEQPLQLTTEQIIQYEVPESEAEKYKLHFDLNKPNVVDFGTIDNLDELDFKNKEFTLNNQILGADEKEHVAEMMEGLKNKINSRKKAKEVEGKSPESKKKLNMI